MEYVIGDFIFASKKEAKDRINTLVQNRVGTKFQGVDHDLLFALLDSHPWRRSIVGKSSIVGFEVMEIGKFHTKTLGARRADGQLKPLSLTRYFSTHNPTKREIFRARCRRAIVPQILQFKRNCFAGKDYAICALTYAPVFWNTCHVDHVVPFECLIRQWEEMTNFDYSQESVEQFADFHQDKAQLRLLSAAANLGRTDDVCDDTERISP